MTKYLLILFISLFGSSLNNLLLSQNSISIYYNDKFSDILKQDSIVVQKIAYSGKIKIDENNNFNKIKCFNFYNPSDLVLNDVINLNFMRFDIDTNSFKVYSNKVIKHLPPIPSKPFLNTGIIDGVYISNLDSFPNYNQVLEKHISEPYLKKINQKLEPFYLAKNEVTTGEYLKFMEYIADSLIKNEILNTTNDKALFNKLLNRKKNASVNFENRQAYIKGFEIDQNYKLTELEIATYGERLFHPPPKRYYKRAEFNLSKLEYVLNDSVRINVVPKIKKNISVSYFNKYGMYLPHDFIYNNYPVSNVSLAQAKAYCKWYNFINKDNLNYHADIPSIHHYEIANTLDKESQKEYRNWSNDYYNWFDLKINTDSRFADSETDNFQFLFTKTLIKKSSVKKNKHGYLKQEKLNNVNNNVSEWLNNDPRTTIIPYLKYYSKYDQLKIKNLNYGATGLIQGGNYLDGRFNSKNQVQIGAYLRGLVNKDEGYDTVGFRLILVRN